MCIRAYGEIVYHGIYSDDQALFPAVEGEIINKSFKIKKKI